MHFEKEFVVDRASDAVRRRSSDDAMQDRLARALRPWLEDA